MAFGFSSVLQLCVYVYVLLKQWYPFVFINDVSYVTNLAYDVGKTMGNIQD